MGPFAVALGLVAIHLFGGKLRFLDVTPRSIWLSGAGGASVAYVFLHILPDLARAQEMFTESSVDGWMAAIERHVWLLALAGVSLFYGLERLVRHSQSTPRTHIFWLHIGSFAAYNLIFGYLLQTREDSGTRELVLFGIAIGLHFLVNDFGLRQDHRAAYDHTARWVLAAALLAGVGVGHFVRVHELMIEALYAVLAGGIILNVLKEELPENRESRFTAFVAGAALYGALLMTTA